MCAVYQALTDECNLLMSEARVEQGLDWGHESGRGDEGDGRAQEGTKTGEHCKEWNRIVQRIEIKRL
jgi:hypothetical protein